MCLHGDCINEVHQVKIKAIQIRFTYRFLLISKDLVNLSTDKYYTYGSQQILVTTMKILTQIMTSCSGKFLD